VQYCRGTGEDGLNTYNVLDVTLADGVPPPSVDVTRNFYTTSSCGVCGKASLDAVRTISRYCPGDDPASVRTETLTALPERLRTAQKVFASTGGLHGAALFTTKGEQLVVREDIGRHNAVDKVVGARLLAGHSPAVPALCVSGRIGFEIVQKAVMADVGAVAAVGAPSSLAVDLAVRAGLCTCGFVRGGRYVVYSAPERLGV
jgi:FdhD protein